MKIKETRTLEAAGMSQIERKQERIIEVETAPNSLPVGAVVLPDGDASPVTDWHDVEEN